MVKPGVVMASIRETIQTLRQALPERVAGKLAERQA